MITCLEPSIFLSTVTAKANFKFLSSFCQLRLIRGHLKVLASFECNHEHETLKSSHFISVFFFCRDQNTRQVIVALMEILPRQTESFGLLNHACPEVTFDWTAQMSWLTSEKKPCSKAVAFTRSTMRRKTAPRPDSLNMQVREGNIKILIKNYSLSAQGSLFIPSEKEVGSNLTWRLKPWRFCGHAMTSGRWLRPEKLSSKSKSCNLAWRTSFLRVRLSNQPESWCQNLRCQKWTRCSYDVVGFHRE